MRTHTRALLLLILTPATLALSSCQLINQALNLGMKAWPLLIDNNGKSKPMPIRTGPVLEHPAPPPVQPEETQMAAR